MLSARKLDCYHGLLVLTDSRYLAKQRRVLSTSSGEFQRCKELVAAAVGYGTEILSGDGKPVNEAGYRSYMLEGRGKDLFFCEVHNNGRYKIKAALGGKFPFKYIAQGKF